MIEILLILATWRITSLIHRESGPFEILARLRHAAGVRYAEDSMAYGTNELANALCCMWCLSVWIGLLVALLMQTTLLHALAYSAGALVVEKIIHGTR